MGVTVTGATEKGRGEKPSRWIELGLFAAAMLWAVAANLIAGRAAAGIAGRLGLIYGQALLEAVFLLFLVVVGFKALRWAGGGYGVQAAILNLPRRRTSSQEWGTGIAIGWGLCLAAVLPPLLIGNMHSRANGGFGMVPTVLSTVATLGVVCLTEEVIFRGYPLQRLMAGLSPAWAAVVMSLVFGAVLVYADAPSRPLIALFDGTLLALLLTMAYLRTHALWLGWGLHFGYRVVMAAVLGLHVPGRNDYGSVMNTKVTGPAWLSGGVDGPDAAVLTGLLMLGAMAVLYRCSLDWAWEYTSPELVPGGYEVTVAPPPAHVAMEKSTLVAPPPLIQIQPVTPGGFSSNDGSASRAGGG